MSTTSSRRRTLVFTLMLTALAVVLFEVSAHVGLRILDGHWSDHAQRAAKRQAVLADPSEATPGEATPSEATPSEAEPSDAEARPRPATASERSIVVHPFFGYTRDPAVANRWWNVTEDGFFARKNPHPDPGTAKRIRIAVLGGSVANHFAFGGWSRMAAEISRATGLPREAIPVTSLAMGGYKQPQQLNVIAHHLARGDPFDVVINLDGFNEMVLPFDNLRTGLSPDYPVNWRTLIGGLPDVDQQRRAGEIAYLDGLRAHRTRLCSGLFTRSAACHLLWRLRDQPLANRQNALRASLAVDSEAPRRFESQGPPPRDLDRSARYAAQVDYWSQASRQIDAIARAHGVRYLHVLQPNQYLPGAKPLSDEERQQAFDPDIHHRSIIESTYPLLRAEGARLQERGVRFFDLTQLFADIEETLYSDTCCHLNTRGNDLLGTAIGRIVAAELAPAFDGSTVQ